MGWEGKTDRPSDWKEKRRYQRVYINSPVDFNVPDESNVSYGLALNASEAGLLIQTFKNMPVGTKMKIKVLSGKGAESSNFRALAAIIWKDTYLWDDWEGYQYGLEFIQILDKNHLKTNLVPNNRPT